MTTRKSENKGCSNYVIVFALGALIGIIIGIIICNTYNRYFTFGIGDRVQATWDVRMNNDFGGCPFSRGQQGHITKVEQHSDGSTDSGAYIYVVADDGTCEGKHEIGLQYFNRFIDQ